MNLRKDHYRWLFFAVVSRLALTHLMSHTCPLTTGPWFWAWWPGCLSSARSTRPGSGRCPLPCFGVPTVLEASHGDGFVAPSRLCPRAGPCSLLSVVSVVRSGLGVRRVARFKEWSSACTSRASHSASGSVCGRRPPHFFGSCAVGSWVPTPLPSHRFGESSSREVQRVPALGPPALLVSDLSLPSSF